MCGYSVHNEILRGLKEEKLHAMIVARDYEALEMHVLVNLMGT